jgi:hypothetical protein
VDPVSEGIVAAAAAAAAAGHTDSVGLGLAVDTGSGTEDAPAALEFEFAPEVQALSYPIDFASVEFAAMAILYEDKVANIQDAVQTPDRVVPGIHCWVDSLVGIQVGLRSLEAVDLLVADHALEPKQAVVLQTEIEHSLLLGCYRRCVRKWSPLHCRRLLEVFPIFLIDAMKEFSSCE